MLNHEVHRGAAVLRAVERHADAQFLGRRGGRRVAQDEDRTLRLRENRVREGTHKEALNRVESARTHDDEVGAEFLGSLFHRGAGVAEAHFLLDAFAEGGDLFAHAFKDLETFVRVGFLDGFRPEHAGHAVGDERLNAQQLHFGTGARKFACFANKLQCTTTVLASVNGNENSHKVLQQ